MLPKAEVSDSRVKTNHYSHSFFQSNKARLMNDLIAGTIGGLVGTAINTPYATALE